MSKPDMKTALRSVSRAETSDRFDMTAAQMVSVRDPSGLVDLPLEQVHPNPDQPRRQFAPAALEELAASLLAVGVLQPILVRRHGDKGYMIVAGERRWRAAKLAGLTTIPAIVRTLDDPATLEAALTENLQREDLTPIEEAQLYQRMVDELGYSIRRLAERLGKGKGYIEDRLRLTRMDADLQALVSGRPDTLTHAREIEKVVDPAERAELIAQVRENALSLQEVRRRIREASLPVQSPLAQVSPEDTDTQRTPRALSGRPDTPSPNDTPESERETGILAPAPVSSSPDGGMLALARQLRHTVVVAAATDMVLEPTLLQELRALTAAVQSLLRRAAGPYEEGERA